MMFEIGTWCLMMMLMVGVLCVKDEEPDKGVKKPIVRFGVVVVSGAFWTAVPDAVVYEASVPLHYEGTWPTRVHRQDAPQPSGGFCTVVDRDCERLRWIVNSTTKLGGRLDWMDTNIGEVSAPLAVSTRRSRRSLSFLGDAFKWCCGVATQKDTDAILTDEKDIERYMNGVRGALHADHDALRNITLGLNAYGDNMTAMLSAIEVREKTRAAEELEIRRATNGKLDEDDVKLSQMLRVTSTLVDLLSHETMVDFRHRVLADCRNRRIPSGVVPPEVLQSDLKALAGALAKDGQSLAISANDVGSYYNLNTAQCVVADGKIIVTIKVPVVRLRGNWKVYQFKTIPFAWNASTCELAEEDTVIAVNGEDLVEVGGHDLDHCNLRGGRMCLLPRVHSRKGARNGGGCIRRLFEGGLATDLANVCAFQCRKRTDLRVTQLAMERYALTNAEAGLRVVCRGGESHDVELPFAGAPGAVEMDVPCGCQLLAQGDVVVREIFPCDARSRNEIAVTHILPHAWSNLDELRPAMEDIASRAVFSTVEHCLDTNWTSRVPHLHFAVVQKEEPSVPSLIVDQDDVFSKMTSHASNASGWLTIVIGVLMMVILVRQPYLVLGCFARPADALDGPRITVWLKDLPIIGLEVIMGVAVIVVLVRWFWTRGWCCCRSVATTGEDRKNEDVVEVDELPPPPLETLPLSGPEDRPRSVTLEHLRALAPGQLWRASTTGADGRPMVIDLIVPEREQV
jgi:hypothetical protein